MDGDLNMVLGVQTGRCVSRHYLETANVCSVHLDILVYSVRSALRLAIKDAQTGSLVREIASAITIEWEANAINAKLDISVQSVKNVSVHQRLGRFRKRQSMR